MQFDWVKFNKVRKRCNSNVVNSRFERVVGELHAKLMGGGRARPRCRWAVAGPGRQRTDSEHRPIGGRRGACGGLQGLAAVPVGGSRARPRCRWAVAGPGRQRTDSEHRPIGGRRGACGARPRCRWAAAGPGRASRSTTPSRRLACGDLAGGPPPPAHTAARPNKHNEAARPHRGRAAHASGR